MKARTFKPHKRMATDSDKLREIEMILKKFIREQSEHNRRMNAFASTQESTNVKLSEDMEEVKRALYGDPKNEVIGIVTTVKNLKAFKTRVVYWGSGLIVGVSVAINFIKDLFHK